MESKTGRQVPSYSLTGSLGSLALPCIHLTPTPNPLRQTDRAPFSQLETLRWEAKQGFSSHSAGQRPHSDGPVVSVWQSVFPSSEFLGTRKSWCSQRLSLKHEEKPSVLLEGWKRQVQLGALPRGTGFGNSLEPMEDFFFFLLQVYNYPSAQLHLSQVSSSLLPVLSNPPRKKENPNTHTRTHTHRHHPS